MPRFVVLEHDHPTLHWDFMLEHAGALKTWRLPVFPPVAGEKLAIQALADHRLAYLTYEGPVSGERGQVIRRDQGTYDFALNSDHSLDDFFKHDRLALILQGGRLRGLVRLEHLDGDCWSLELQQ